MSIWSNFLALGQIAAFNQNLPLPIPTVKHGGGSTMLSTTLHLLVASLSNDLLTHSLVFWPGLGRVRVVSYSFPFY